MVLYMRHLRSWVRLPFHVLDLRQWFSGKIQRCHRWAPSSILGWRIFLFRISAHTTFRHDCSHCFLYKIKLVSHLTASIAQLGERKTEDLEAPCSIHGRSTCRGGLVGYDAALTQLRSWVRFPFLVLCASGLVVKSNVAIVGPRVRFSAGA